MRFLYGITRKSILEIASDEGIDVKIEKIPLCELENAKEVFLTSSSHLVKVIKIDNEPVSKRWPSWGYKQISDEKKGL